MKQAGSLINFLPVCFADQNLSNQRIKSLLNFNTSKDIRSRRRTSGSSKFR